MYERKRYMTKQSIKKEIKGNESVVIMSAVRYMLGRSSYGVGSVCDYLKTQKDRLTQSNKEVICRDIREYVEKNPDITYKNDWLKIVELLTP